MASTFEKITTIVLTMAAVAVAGAALHREFGSGSRSAIERISRQQLTALEAGGHQIGKSDARIRVVIFSDVECPFCARFHKTVMTALSERPSDFSISYRHFPLDRHQSAWRGAEALICADRQERFEPMLSVLFGKQDALSKRDTADMTGWVSDASQAGIVDTSAFRDCLSQNADRETIEQDRHMGDALGLNATPMVLIGNRIHTGALDPQQFDKELSREIDRQSWPLALQRAADWIDRF